jgi:hypothetical protein
VFLLAPFLLSALTRTLAASFFHPLAMKSRLELDVGVVPSGSFSREHPVDVHTCNSRFEKRL